jgi:hypothetical protein
MRASARTSVTAVSNHLTTFKPRTHQKVRRLSQVIVHSEHIISVFHNQGVTARSPRALLDNNPISRSTQLCAHRERDIYPMMKLAPLSNRMLTPPIRASSIDVITLRPGL